MNISQIKENKCKTILQFSIPSIIAMLLQTIITITDGYFTGNYVGESALAAINLGLPILYFYLGVGLCVGVGGSVHGCRRNRNMRKTAGSKGKEKSIRGIFTNHCNCNTGLYCCFHSNIYTLYTDTSCIKSRCRTIRIFHRVL